MTSRMPVTAVEPVCPVPTALGSLNLYLTVSAYPRKRA